VLLPNAELTVDDQLAVGPSGRGAGIWLLPADADERARLGAEVSAHLEHDVEGIDLLAWLTPEGEPANRWAAVSGSGIELRFRPGEQVRDARGRGWELDGDPAALSARIDAGRFLSDDYPDALGRLWAALANPNAGDILVSLAPGWECVDWGGADHVPGGSHGSLLATDSLGALLTVGLDGKRPERLQWAISDVYDLIVGHFGIDD
jgi:hypothetical protein